MLNYACKILYEKSDKMNSFSKIVSTNDSIKGKIVPLVRLLLIGQRGRTELHTFFVEFVNFVKVMVLLLTSMYDTLSVLYL